MVKYGERLARALTGSWADRSLPYDNLKDILAGLSEHEEPAKRFVAEGKFVTDLLAAIHAMSTFYQEMEAQYEEQLSELGSKLEHPEKWLGRPDMRFEADTDLLVVIKSLEVGKHIDPEHSSALESFVELCTEVDSLRKFSLLNALAVSKNFHCEANASPLAPPRLGTTPGTQRPLRVHHAERRALHSSRGGAESSRSTTSSLTPRSS